jgi:NADPH:quinone reductase-like Zn-dependent oxidoreductase
VSNKQVIISAFGTPQVINVINAPTLPEPKRGEVRIKVEASSVCFSDVIIRKGIYPNLNVTFPLTLGYDLVGVVDKLGEGVTNITVGQRVADLTQTGSNAEYTCRPSDRLVPVPATVDPAEAETMVLTYMTAYQMYRHIANVKSGQTVLIHGGAGAVGTALLDIGRHLGLNMVSTASSQKLDLLRAYGAIAIDYRAANYTQQLRSASSTGYDAVFDGVGFQSFLRSFRLLKRGGVLVNYGAASSASSVKQRSLITSIFGPVLFFVIDNTLLLLNVLPNGRSVKSYEISTLRQEQPDLFVTDLKQLFELLASGKIKPVISERLSLDDAVRGHELIERGNVRGRLVFVTNQSKTIG